MKKQNAFTLAEVLITLGIIGVVAAMTLPTLLNSVQGSQYRAQLKKAMSSLSNALVMSVAQDDYDAGIATTGTGTMSLMHIFASKLHVANADGSYGTWTYTNKAGVSTNTIGGNSNYTFLMNDGSVISFPTGKKECLTMDASGYQTATDQKCVGVIDVNGEKNPNREAKCDETVTGQTGVAACKVNNAYDIYPITIEPQAIRLRTIAGLANFGKGK